MQAIPAIICAVLAGLCWGVGEIFTKSAINTREIGPLGTLMIRAVVTLPLAVAGFFVAYRFLQSEPAWWRDYSTLQSPGAPTGMRASTWAKVIVGSGVLAGFAGAFFFYIGLSLKGGDISVLRPVAFALAPATAVLLGWWFLGEEMTVRKAAAVVLIIAGILMLAGEGRKGATKEPALTDARSRVAADSVPMVE